MDKLRFGTVELWGTVHQSSACQDGRQLPALELRIQGGADASMLEAMQNCPLEVLDEQDQVQGVHEGYTKLMRHSVLLARADEAQLLAEMKQRCEALEKENAALRQQSGAEAE